MSIQRMRVCLSIASVGAALMGACVAPTASQEEAAQLAIDGGSLGLEGFTVGGGSTAIPDPWKPVSSVTSAGTPTTTPQPSPWQGYTPPPRGPAPTSGK